METLGGEQQRRTVGELVALLRTRWADRAAGRPDEALGALVHEARAWGEPMELRSRRALEIVSQCFLVFGPPPWPRAWSAPLCDGDCPASLRNMHFLARAERALGLAAEAVGR